MNKFVGILVGLVVLLSPVYAWIINFKGFGDAALVFLKGGLMWVMLLAGLVSLVVGFTSLKE
ncbi:hypothetical protein KAS08_00960 [Candidatus Pacearchaeota archaeon]|nr:hypothetical protein [Candidatus Pacearchaeota archaeon]